MKIPISGEPIKSKEQLRRIMLKTAKGVTTELTSVAEKTLKYYTRSNLYDYDHSYFTGAEDSAYNRTGGFYKSIVSDKTERTANGWKGSARFSAKILNSYRIKPEYKTTRTGKKRLVMFGSYTDVTGKGVATRLLDERWVDEGTEPPSLVPRIGANIMRDSVDSIQSQIDSGKIEAIIRASARGIKITKISR